MVPVLDVHVQQLWQHGQQWPPGCRAVQYRNTVRAHVNRELLDCDVIWRSRFVLTLGANYILENEDLHCSGGARVDTSGSAPEKDVQPLKCYHFTAYWVIFIWSTFLLTFNPRILVQFCNLHKSGNRIYSITFVGRSAQKVLWSFASKIKAWKISVKNFYVLLGKG